MVNVKLTTYKKLGYVTKKHLVFDTLCQHDPKVISCGIGSIKVDKVFS